MNINEPIVLRSDLIEGRSEGMGFSLFKKEEKGYTPVIEFTACKDFLNEISYGEFHKQDVAKQYGFKHKHCNYFEHDDEHMYMCLNTVAKKGGTYAKFDEFEKTLIDNYKGLKKVLNYFDKKMGVKPCKVTLLTVKGQKTILIKADRFWMKETVLLSFYTLMARVYFNYDKRVSKKNILAHKPFIPADAYIVNTEQMEFLFKNFSLLTQYHKESLPKDRQSNQIHSNGIAYHIKKWIEDEKK